MGWQQQGPSGAGKPFTLLFWFEEGLSPSSNQTRRVHGLPAPLEPCCHPMDPQVCQFFATNRISRTDHPGGGSTYQLRKAFEQTPHTHPFPRGRGGGGHPPIPNLFRTSSSPPPASPPPGRGVGEEAPTSSEHIFCACECLSRVQSPEPRTGFTRPKQSLCFVAS